MTKRFIPVALALLCLLLSMQMPRGMHYEHRKLPGPISVHIFTVDPEHACMKLVHAGDNMLDLETVSSMAKHHRAFAAVNGGFFRKEGRFGGCSSGVLKIDHQWLSEPRRNRAALGWKNDGKEVLIDRLGLQADLKIHGESFPIDAINQPRAQGQTVLYTDFFYPYTLTDLKGIEVAIDAEGRVISIKDQGITTIPPKGFVYSIDPGSPLEIPTTYEGEVAQCDFIPLPQNEPENSEAWEEMKYVVGGTPVLIFNGNVITDFTQERTIETFLTKQHPRTAVGILPNGDWVFVVVDGKLPEVSLGMTMNELAQFMHSLGCVYALNLDGGGSSALYIKDQLRNTPSGVDEDSPDAKMGDERPVSDAILIFAQ